MYKSLAPSLVKVTKALSNLEFHDVLSLSTSLAITRIALHKAIEKLENYGIIIKTPNNEVYRLTEPLLLIDKADIEAEFVNSNLQIEVFENLDSTNNYLKREHNFNLRRICIAETQSSGKGRLGRHWHSPFGQNIHLSYAYPFQKNISELSGLSLVIGIACINAFREYGIKNHIKLKWPNDGVFLEKKLMGILVEIETDKHGCALAIIGIGINANMLDSANQINQNWTSLRKITDEYIDRTKLCIALIHNLNLALEQFSCYGLKEFLNQWQELDSLYDKNIELNNGEYKGIAKGINLQGHLMVELEDKSIKCFSYGEASIDKQRTGIKL